MIEGEALETHALIRAIIKEKVSTHARAIGRGDVFLYQGKQAEHIGIILSGTIFAQTYTKDGHTVWVEEFTSNQFIAIESLFSATPLPYELIAKTETRIIYLSREKFLDFIKLFDGGIEAILQDISARLNRATERLIEANTLSAKGRICAELKRHSKPIGIEPDKHIIRPRPVFSEFALRVGSTRESVSRTVSDLVRTGVILRQTGALVVSDMDKLEAWIR